MERPYDKYLSGRPFFIPHTIAAFCHSVPMVRNARVAVTDGGIKAQIQTDPLRSFLSLGRISIGEIPGSQTSFLGCLKQFFIGRNKHWLPIRHTVTPFTVQHGVDL